MNRRALSAAVLLAGAVPSRAIIDPALQPRELLERFVNVAAAEIRAVDVGSGEVTLAIPRVFKGVWTPGAVVAVEASESMRSELARRAKGAFAPGRSVVLWGGRRRGARASEFLMYADNLFFSGVMDAQERWSWTAADAQTEGRDVGTMRGIFNGETEQLIALLEDIAADRDHFPRRAYARFAPDFVLATLPEGATGGLAAADFDGDGRLDLFVACTEGDRIFMQIRPMRFADATAPLGLSSRSRVVAAADADGDGVPDLLLDGVFVQVVREGRRVRFVRTEALPPLDRRVMDSVFADFDGDGRPDALIALEGGGLRVFRNDLGGSGFREMTGEWGLDEAQIGRGTGFIAVGDFNADDRMDIFYSSAPGFLLTRGEGPRFRRIPLSEPLDFDHAGGGADARAGGAAFVAVRDGAADDLVVAVESEYLIFREIGGMLRNVTRHGGEISEGSFRHFGVVADDFDLDGRLDIYGTARGVNGQHRLLLNRGYGLFMWAELNSAVGPPFRGPAHERGASGAISADFNADGAPDLALVNDTGHVVLLLNEAPAAQAPREHPPRDERNLARMRRVAVAASSPVGMTSAIVELRSAEGRLIRRRAFSGGRTPGSAAPPGATLVAPGPGRYLVRVRYSDGTAREYPVDVTEEAGVTLDAAGDAARGQSVRD